jgi:DNA polymerase
MPKDVMNLDYETFSEVDLTEVGSHNYAIHPSTEILMCAYRINMGPKKQWVPAEGEPCPPELEEAMTDPDVEKWAWNAAFEMTITKNVWKKPVNLRQWRDTMVLGHYCGFPGQLEKAGPALGLPESLCKNPDGSRLMRKFSMMKPSRKKANYGEMERTFWWQDAEDWKGYLGYNLDDVEAESQIREILIRHDLPSWEWENWFLDQQINQAGLPINMDMVNNAVRIYDAAFAKGLAEMQEVTGLDNPMSTQQLLPWLNANGYMFEDCKKGHIRQAFDYFKKKPDHWEESFWDYYRSNEVLRDALSLRLELSRSSIKKFAALQRAVSPDGNLRNVLQFMGAQRTGRWAGRTFQPQNLPRPDKRFEKGIEVHAANIARLDLEGIELIYDNTFDLLASCIRPAAQAPEGYLFIDADLNAIENRVLGWLSGCKKILRVFELGRDPYIDFATYLYDEPYESLWEEYQLGNGAKRTIAKPGVLGCGYMLGPGKVFEDRQTGEIEATGLLGYAWNMGVRHFTLEQSELSVATFRREFKEVKDYWYAIERAALTCVRERRATSCGHVMFDLVDGKKEFDFGDGGPTLTVGGEFLRMKLPSGRYLHYFRPRIQPTKMPWKDDQGKTVFKDSLTYEGVNDKKQWVRMSTHPGKLTENADQAISRDLLVHGMKLARWRHKLDIRLHVHDQNLALVRKEQADEALEILRECMEDSPEWAGGLPLGSAGFTSTVFKKD